MSIGIYKITNKINGHSYIGQSIDIERRWIHHRNYKSEMANYPLYRAFQKYGIKNFSFEVLEECLENQLNERECYYIQLYDTYYNGYNQTLGGSGSAGNTVKLSINDIEEIYDLLINSSITQREIAKLFQVGEDTISEINTGKTRRNDNFSYPLRENKKKNYCIDCGKEISLAAKRCFDCNNKALRVTNRPNREELKNLIRTVPFIQIGNRYGVSDNAVRKWCMSENLPYKKTEIKKLSDAEWERL